VAAHAADAFFLVDPGFLSSELGCTSGASAHAGSASDAPGAHHHRLGLKVLRGPSGKR
jgi:hypothetical protein